GPGRGEARGADRQQVRPETGQTGRDVGGPALAHADEGHHRGDADDDAEHGERRPQPVRAEAGQGKAEQLANAHATTPSTTWPSCRWICRSAVLATSASWV